jgi:predicted RNase H-like HicB family nuclease
LTERRWQVLCLPQKDGSFVASVLEAPEIVVYQKSRKAAEQEASKIFLRQADPHGYRAHPLAKTRAITVDMEFDEEAGAFVTYVKELHGISTFGNTEIDALNKTAEMIRGYIRSMEGNHKRIPLSAAKLAAVRRLVGLA